MNSVSSRRPMLHMAHHRKRKEGEHVQGVCTQTTGTHFNPSLRKSSCVKLSPSDEKALAKSLKKKANQAKLPNVTFKMELADSLVSEWIARIEKTKQ